MGFTHQPVGRVAIVVRLRLGRNINRIDPRLLATVGFSTFADVLNFLRITAGAFGASVATTLWDNRASMHHAYLTEHIDVTNPAFASGAGTLTRSLPPPPEALAIINHAIDNQAFMLAAADIFRASAVLFMALMLLVWHARPPKAASAAGAADAGGAH